MSVGVCQTLMLHMRPLSGRGDLCKSKTRHTFTSDSTSVHLFLLTFAKCFMSGEFIIHESACRLCDEWTCNAHHHHHHYHPLLNREGRWGTTDDFATSFLHFSLFSSALWDLLNSRSVHFPDVVFPPLPLSALSSSPFH